MKGAFRAAAAALLFCMSAAGAAQERSAIKPDFAFPTDRQPTIVVFRPEVQVGTLTAGGVDEPNADWTGSARNLIEEAMRRNDTVSGAKIVFAADPEGDDGAYLAEYRALFRAVAQSIQIHKLFVGQRLPTKRETFDWTLGEGTQRIAQMTGADYALFFFTHDAYGSAGRKTAQIFGAMLGVAIIPGVHIGYAGLVDLKSGDVIWFNADPQMGGDVRTAEGADKRVGQLLDGFPGRMVPDATAPVSASK
jgi:hypothetical protein